MQRKIVFFLFLLFVPIVYADTSLFGMSWIYQGAMNGTALWLNFTSTDLGGKPEYLCFGLLNESVCLTKNPSSMNLMGQSIYNVTQINTTYLRVNECIYNSTGSCFTLTELNTTSGTSLLSNNITGNGQTGKVVMWYNETHLNHTELSLFETDPVSHHTGQNINNQGYNITSDISYQNIVCMDTSCNTSIRNINGTIIFRVVVT